MSRFNFAGAVRYLALALMGILFAAPVFLLVSGSLMSRWEPVSYTHLDVYKRQVINLINSRTGRAIMAIRDNRIAAESIGVNVTRYKLLAFAVSAALAGTAGVLYAHNLSTLTALPKNFGYNMSITILVDVYKRQSESWQAGEPKG